MNCEICGKPQSPYPNWLISKGHYYHVGCLAEDYRRIKERHTFLYNKCQASGAWGPWADDWEGSYECEQWRAENEPEGNRPAEEA